MLRRIDLRGKRAADLAPGTLAGTLPRARLDVDAALDAVAPICADVRRRGAEAVREHTARLDGVDLASTRVPVSALGDALAALDTGLRAALEEAARRIRLAHQAQVPAESVTEVAPGSTVTERYLPVGRAGVYVPGGLVAYPSSVLMNVIPAQVAGVSEIAVASPPRADGSDRAGLPHAVVLAACALLGITEVHAAGGAQAVAMLGYGTADCASVDVITGPGNVYVAAAKRLLSGLVAVDAEAGPTEIAVIADRDADPALVAADLVAQAEHDRLAACLLISTDAGLADRVDAEVARLTGEPADPRAAGAAGESAGDGTGARSDRTAQQSASARTGAREATVGQDAVQAARERILAALRGQSACVLVDNLDAALAVADSWAPEHLEIQAADAAGLARRVRNAGAVFAGPFAPVSLGDYLAGSNHVLPTGGTARHSGGLSVLSFLRCVHLVECDRAALAAAAPYIDALGAAEDLPGHVAAVRARVASAPSAGHRAGPGRR